MASAKKDKRDLHGPEAVMRDTIEWLLALPPGKRAELEMADNYTFSMSKPAPQVELGAAAAGSGRASKTSICTLQHGSVEAAELLVQRGFRPALLNFAHGYNCGGGFEHSAGSQEEDIFRKTSVFLSLWPHRRSDDGPNVLKRGPWIGDYDDELPRKEPFYEHTECGVIYSPNVSVVRDTAVRGHPLRDASECDSLATFAVITAAAQNVGFAPPFKPKLLMEKARSILWLAAARGHDSVVLGAFGCGYFHNPPKAVAETFYRLLGPNGEFENVFSLVVFAVIHGNQGPFTDLFPVLKAKALPTKRADKTPAEFLASLEREKDSTELFKEAGYIELDDLLTCGLSFGVGMTETGAVKLEAAMKEAKKSSRN